jgi:hypothetical protein
MRFISDYPLPSSKWKALLRLPLFWILLVGLLAMGGALRADFYMDDAIFITKPDGLSPVVFRLDFMGHSFGSKAPDAWVVSIFQIIPTLLTALSNWLFPMSSPAAHVWNLSIHLILAVLVFRLGERLLRRLQLLSTPEVRRSAALVGALIFACHPLATEPVHYAKCHMVQLVSLFGFWATCEAVEYFAAPTRRRAFRLVLSTILCVLSYFPGTVLLGFNLLVVVLFTLGGSGPGTLKKILPSRATLRHPAFLVGAAFAAAVAIGLGKYFIGSFINSRGFWGDYAEMHVPTQGRVFWEYVQRILIPIHLSSDHYQPWSTYRDPEAVIKLTLFGLLLISTGLAALRKGATARRGCALMLCFALIPFAMRLLYINIEIMVEYRAYNSLPWIGLLAGCGLASLAARIPQARLRWLPAGAIIVIFTLLSMERGKVWRSALQLAEDSIAQYPLNNRARNQLQMFDLYMGDYLSVLTRHGEIMANYDKIEEANRLTANRRRIDPIRAKSNLIYSLHYVVHAKGQIEGFVKAMAFADSSITSLKEKLPAAFEVSKGQTLSPAWPLLMAREAMAKASKAQASFPSTVPPAPLPGS